MAETLEAWVTRQLKLVDESGKCTAQLSLQAGDGGHIWDRWDAPLRSEEGGPGPVALAQLISEVIDSAAEEWPAKRSHQIMVTAFDHNGAERARYVKSVRGKNQAANSGAMMGTESQQHAQAMQMQVETMKVLLGASASMVHQQQETIGMLLQNTTALTALVVEQKVKNAIASEEAGHVAQAEMWELAKQAAPGVIELLSGAMKKS